MDCPRCEIELVTEVKEEMNQSLEYHSCSLCEGIWISKPVLNFLERIKEPVAFEVLNIDSKIDQLIGLDCPSCGEDQLMKKAEHPRDERVIMDVCESCEGIWLDKGELRAIQQEGILTTLAKLLGIK
jgi:Zn-finger nucleic acid-binding protein